MSNNHVGPIIFSHEIARAQLVEHGEVVTFRESQRTTGDTWWRKSRTGPKQGDAHVAEIGEYHLRKNRDVFENYVVLSGFDSVDDWFEAIRNLNDSPTYSGYLYRATLID